MAAPLVIEYVFEGYRRGYNFTSSTAGYGEHLLKAVWRRAMPRGQGWAAPEFAGARSLKCFPVDGHGMALSEITVTALRDENGRGGIRRAVIDLLPPVACIEHLRRRLSDYPVDVQAALDGRPSLGQWKRVIDQALPKIHGSGQLVLSRAYTGPQDWQLIESIILKIAVSRVGKLAHSGRIIPFTTLALDSREELSLVGIPSRLVPSSSDVNVIAVD